MGVHIVNLNGTNYMALSQSMAYISHDSTPPHGWGARPPPHIDLLESAEIVILN